MSKFYSKLTDEQKAKRSAYYKEYRKRPDRVAKTRAKAVKDQQTRRDKLKLLLQAAKNKPCTDCGVTYPPEIMEFDHVRGEKLINLSQASRAKSYLSWEAMQEEIAKCDIRCPNCHRLRHYYERHSPE